MKWIFFKDDKKIEPCMCLKWQGFVWDNGRYLQSTRFPSYHNHLFWQFVWFGSNSRPYLSDGKVFAGITLLRGNNFCSVYGVFLLLTCFWDQLYRQPCLLLKYSAVSSVSHYCWWSFISWSKWKEFWYRAVEDT